MRQHLISANHIWQRQAELLFMTWNPTSQLQREIDWYLNFSISRGLRHQSQSLSRSQEDLLQEVGLELKQMPNAKEQILCLAPPHFFSRYVVVAPTKNMNSFSELFHQSILWLKPSRASVILPTSVPVEDFRESLQKLGFDREVFIAVDVSTVPA